jgi:hypothetical protein
VFVSGKEAKFIDLQCQMLIFNSLCTSYDEWKYCTSDPERLEKTIMKQNDLESLTNIKKKLAFDSLS